ncbi:hypothetical protein IWX48DRAFT_640851 [Phyllosticta citricarpa]
MFLEASRRTSDEWGDCCNIELGRERYEECLSSSSSLPRRQKKYMVINSRERIECSDSHYIKSRHARTIRRLIKRSGRRRNNEKRRRLVSLFLGPGSGCDRQDPVCEGATYLPRASRPASHRERARGVPRQPKCAHGGCRGARPSWISSAAPWRGGGLDDDDGGGDVREAFHLVDFLCCSSRQPRAIVACALGSICPTSARLYRAGRRDILCRGRIRRRALGPRTASWTYIPTYL